jgi:hypothetical protein
MFRGVRAVLDDGEIEACLKIWMQRRVLAIDARVGERDVRRKMMRAERSVHSSCRRRETQIAANRKSQCDLVPPPLSFPSHRIASLLSLLISSLESPFFRHISPSRHHLNNL